MKYQDTKLGKTISLIVKNDVIYSAANIDDSWIGVDLGALFKDRLGIEAHCVNDADAAGIAEMTFGKGKGQMGLFPSAIGC